MGDQNPAAPPFDETFKVGEVITIEPGDPEDRWRITSVARDEMTVELVEEPKPKTRGPRTPNRRWPFS